MPTFEEMRDRLGRTLESLSEGWAHLVARAGQALTPFRPVRHGGDLETVEDAVARGGARWGLLAAEVQETDQEVIVRLEAPGMDREGFGLYVVDDVLVIQGEKQVSRERRRGRYHLMECAYGAFERMVPLPAAVDDRRAAASYRDGVLEVVLPLAGREQARRIQVESL